MTQNTNWEKLGKMLMAHFQEKKKIYLRSYYFCPHQQKPHLGPHGPKLRSNMSTFLAGAAKQLTGNTLRAEVSLNRVSRVYVWRCLRRSSRASELSVQEGEAPLEGAGRGAVPRYHRGVWGAATGAPASRSRRSLACALNSEWPPHLSL